MANALYDTGRNAFLTGDIDWEADTIKVVLVDAADYTVDLAAHDFLDDIPAGARVATATLANTSSDGTGVADADDAVFSTVSGDQSEALVIYKDTGVEATSQLIAYIDTATGLPITPGGGNVTVQWNASGIFKL